MDCANTEARHSYESEQDRLSELHEEVQSALVAAQEEMLLAYRAQVQAKLTEALRKLPLDATDWTHLQEELEVVGEDIFKSYQTMYEECEDELS